MLYYIIPSKEYKKLYHRLTPECRETETLVTDLLGRLGAEVLYGQAPRASLERRSQELLKAVEGPAAPGGP